jgi:catechol 2,3-dioxygenase-like lactoylglutathione lyase family enzyme
VAQSLFLTAVLVKDYDEAIAFYVGALGFEIRLDNRLSAEKRWVVLAPAGGAQGCILLAKADGPYQIEAVGNQAGGRVFLFLETDDFYSDYAAYVDRGVQFIEAPRTEDYGKVAVFVDLYGNKWDLIEHTPPQFRP